MRGGVGPAIRRPWLAPARADPLPAGAGSRLRSSTRSTSTALAQARWCTGLATWPACRRRAPACWCWRACRPPATSSRCPACRCPARPLRFMPLPALGTPWHVGGAVIGLCLLRPCVLPGCLPVTTPASDAVSGGGHYESLALGMMEVHFTPPACNRIEFPLRSTHINLSECLWWCCDVLLLGTIRIAGFPAVRCLTLLAGYFLPVGTNRIDCFLLLPCQLLFSELL